ncbi:MAG: L,D-transpeptidase [Planctomycetota bacterium]
MSRHLPAPLTLALALSLSLVGCQAPPAQTWAQWQRAPVTPDPWLPAAADAMPQPLDSPTVEPSYAPGYNPGDPATTGEGFDLALRHPDFPNTFISDIYIDITDGRAHTRITWMGPKASDPIAYAPELEPTPIPTGPWRVSAGRGVPGTDCDDPETSNTTDTLCTPKGTFVVAGFADHLNSVPSCHYATWVVHAPRYIAIHSHTSMPRYPASGGCIRMNYGVAKLIHNNSITGITRVHIGGRWKPHEPMFIHDDSRPSSDLNTQ